MGQDIVSKLLKGSIIPPKIDDFQLTTSMSPWNEKSIILINDMMLAVSASGSVAISLEASIEVKFLHYKSPFVLNFSRGQLARGTFQLSILGFQVWIFLGKPCACLFDRNTLIILRVAEIGPAIEVDGSVDLDIGVQTNAYINVDWNLSNIQLVLPSSAGQSFANASPSSSDRMFRVVRSSYLHLITFLAIHLSINPESTSLSVNVTGHIVPKVNNGTIFFSGDLLTF